VHIPSRVDLEEFASPTRPHSEFRARLGLPRDESIVAFAAALNTSKGVEIFEEAVHLVSDPTALFAVAGDGPLRSRVEALASRYRRVRYLGQLDRSRMRDFFCAADIVVQPSRDEGQPRTVLEAMSCCRPVIATDVGGIPEIVQHRRTGLLIPPNDALALAGAIDELLGDAEYRDTLGHAARAFVCAHHSFDDGIARLQKLYGQ
jgi:glycosyltransferase involved in cell wall biosynthesis